MWRWAITLVLVALFHLGQASAAPTVHCQIGNFLARNTGFAPVIPTSSAVLDGVSYPVGGGAQYLILTSSVVNLAVGGARGYYASASTLVEPGSPCPAGTPSVLMPYSSYETMINTAQVVTKLGEMTDM